MTPSRTPRRSKVRPGSPYFAAANTSLRYLETLFPRSIGELCFIDRSGAENARVVHGRPALVSDLSADKAGNPFFATTFALRPGHVFQSRPYVSPDTQNWVVGNATPLAVGRAAAPAIVHYELSVESLRRDLVGADSAFVLRVVDSRSGRVIIDGRHPQRVGAPLGVPSNHRFAGFHPRPGAAASSRSRGARAPTAASSPSMATRTSGFSSPPRRHRPPPYSPISGSSRARCWWSPSSCCRSR